MVVELFSLSLFLEFILKFILELDFEFNLLLIFLFKKTLFAITFDIFNFWLLLLLIVLLFSSLIVSKAVKKSVNILLSNTSIKELEVTTYSAIRFFSQKNYYFLFDRVIEIKIVSYYRGFSKMTKWLYIMINKMRLLRVFLAS